MLLKSQKAGNAELADFYEHNETNGLVYQREFRDVSQHALEGSKNFIITRMSPSLQFANQISEYLGLAVFQSFDLIEVLVIFAQIL